MSKPAYTELAPTRNGDHGGDRGMTTSWSRRFARPLDSNSRGATHAVVELDFYIAQDLDNTASLPYLEQETTYTLCTNPDRPGDTEVWSDARYTIVPTSRQVPIDEDARAACAAAQVHKLTWNGNPDQLPAN